MCPNWDTSKPHVFTYLNTIPNIRRLTTSNTITVINFATAVGPVSVEFCLLKVVTREHLFPASPLARAGNARLWVNVSLCIECDKLLCPMLLRVAALKSAYSKSKASNNEYLVITLLLRRLSQGSECRAANCGIVPPILAIEEADEAEPEATFTYSPASSALPCLLWGIDLIRRAWLGWSQEQLILLLFDDGVGDNSSVHGWLGRDGLAWNSVMSSKKLLLAKKDIGKVIQNCMSSLLELCLHLTIRDTV